MPLVKAIESGRGQTESFMVTWKKCGVRAFSNAYMTNPNLIESRARAGDSPVGVSHEVMRRVSQSIMRRNSRENMGGTNIQP